VVSRPLWKSEDPYPPPDVGFPDVDLGDDVGGLVALVLTLLIALVFVLVLVFFWPLLSLLVALAVGGVALLARVLGIASWTVRAVSAERTLKWRVRAFCADGG
jgi:hypothetical protein